MKGEEDSLLWFLVPGWTTAEAGPTVFSEFGGTRAASRGTNSPVDGRYLRGLEWSRIWTGLRAGTEGSLGDGFCTKAGARSVVGLDDEPSVALTL